MTILCMSSYFKGSAFFREAKRRGWRVLLLTVEKLGSADWPREAIDEVHLMPDLNKRHEVINAVSYLTRSQVIDRIVALDEFDIETAATLREHLRVPGMGETTSRYFRDKLAMRIRAEECGVAVPAFVPVTNHARIHEFTEEVRAPWVLKPRSSASAIGIKKLESKVELWSAIDALGDEQSFQVLEQFIPGDIFHVDSITSETEVVFSSVSQYGQTPFSVMHEGGIFSSRLLPRESAEVQSLESLNRELLRCLGFLRGVAHAEFIQRKQDHRFYFLEVASRVGGANIAEMVEAATGVNLWAEWAKIETSTKEHPYVLEDYRRDYSGIIISLAKQEVPDTAHYNDKEIVWRMNKEFHAGLIVASHDPETVHGLIENYTTRFYNDFYTSAPAPDKPTE
jgi:Biotin carboxylase